MFQRALIVAALLLTGTTAFAQTLTVAETEALVRARYFEGMPEAEAARIGPEGADRLVEMLADPSERASHGQVMLALGICGAATDTLAAIQAWRAQPRSGEIDRDTFAAWQMLPYALGHLAQHDPRAVALLEELLSADAPNWRFRHHQGARLARLARRSAASSLAETGLPSARLALERAGQRTSDADFEAHLRSLRARHAERAQERAE